MRLHRKAAIVGLLLASTGCRHAAPPTALPSDWQTLVQKPSPFAALYRLSCCGHRDLILTVRAGTETLSLAVAVPPGGTALSAWLEPDGGWLRRSKENCREALPKGVLPVSESSSLPLAPELATLLLAGMLPPGARELPGLPGWVEASTAGFTWRAQVEGPEPRCTRVQVTRPGGAGPLLVAQLDGTPGRVPGVMSMPRRISLVAGSVKAELRLEAWQTSESPAPPPWLSSPICGARP